jgi:hypothetical protein
MKKLAGCVLLLTFCFALDASTGKKRIELDPGTTKELLNVVKQSELLHKYLFDRKTPQANSQINVLKSNINAAIKKSKGQKVQHISRILAVISKDLSGAQLATGQERIKYLQSAYKQIVMLYQSYELNATYKVFFCNTDRAVWIQEEGKKPENPFQVTSGCGKKVF